MTANPADKREAEETLAVVERSRSAAAEALRPGILDVVLLCVARFVGFEVTPGHTHYSATARLGGLAAGTLLIVVGYRFLQQRYKLGGRIGMPTWIAAGATAIATSIGILAFDGRAEKTATALAFAAVLLALSLNYRSWLMGAIGGFTVLIGLSIAYAWSTPVLAVVGLSWIAVAAYLGRKQFWIAS